MERKSNHSKLFYQYLLSYVLMLAIPLIILSVFMGGYVLDILKEEIRVNNMNTLQNAKNIVEAQLQHVTSTEHKVYLNNMLEGFLLEDETVTAINTKQKLEAYRQMNPFLVDIAYYQEDDDYIIAASSSCLKEKFWNTMYVYENWDYEGFLKDLDTNAELFFKESQQVYVKRINFKRIVTLVIPLEANGKRCVILLMDEDFFTNVMPQPDMQKEASAILDENGHVLISKGKGGLIGAENTKVLKTNKNTDIVTIDGEQYLRSYVHSENYHWTYESLVLISSIEEKAVYVRLLMFFICFLTCVVGAIGIIYFMKQNYIPLQKLEITSNEILKNEENRNEIDHIKTVLDYLSRQNQRLEAEEESRKNTLKERFISRWMSGHYENSEQIREQAAKVGIELYREFYQVAVLHIYKGKSVEGQKIEEIILQAVPDCVDMFVRVQAEAKNIFFVAGYDGDGREAVEKYFLECVDLLQNEIKLKGWLALGNPFHDDVRLKDSYKEALKALEYSIILDDRKIIRYEEIGSWNGNVMLDIQPGWLENYVRNRDVEGLENFLNASLAEMKSKKTDIRQIRMLCNEFIYALQKTIADANRDYFIEGPLFDNITGILEYDTVCELMEIIRLIACDIIEHLEEQSVNTIKEKLLVYIAENCFSADFSTTAMAEEFQMSLSYLSRYFKKHIGKNLLDYVTELKIDRAKELLLYEDRPIKEVAEEVGYYSVNSFNRRFKQVSGYTPGEWRMQKK